LSTRSARRICVIYGRNIPVEWRHGTEGFKAYGQMLRAAFPDIRIRHASTVTQGEYQSIRWTFTGHPRGTVVRDAANRQGGDDVRHPADRERPDPRAVG
jgi:predicted ester cyclase